MMILTIFGWIIVVLLIISLFYKTLKLILNWIEAKNALEKMKETFGKGETNKSKQFIGSVKRTGNKLFFARAFIQLIKLAIIIILLYFLTN